MNQNYFKKYANIYHHLDHIGVSFPASLLRKTLEIFSKKFLNIALKFFREYIGNTKKQDYLAFLNWKDTNHIEGIHYLANTLFELHLIDNRKELFRLFSRNNYIIRGVDETLAERVHRNIVMTKFNSKTNLMKQFSDNVRERDRYRLPIILK